VSRLRFELRYWTGDAPWDSGVTPPEVIAFLDRAAPGRALDLGCGTGTNAIAMAQRGWHVTAVDFSARAIQHARRKARRAETSVLWLRRDVTELEDLAGPFEFALDLGCYHSLDPAVRSRYVANLARLLLPGATYMLYAFLDPAEGWPAEDEIRRALDTAFDLSRLEHGEYHGRASGWFTWIRRS
jgi:SAM-dependent methyltransferase